MSFMPASREGVLISARAINRWDGNIKLAQIAFLQHVLGRTLTHDPDHRAAQLFSADNYPGAIDHNNGMSGLKTA